MGFISRTDVEKSVYKKIDLCFCFLLAISVVIMIVLSEIHFKNRIVTIDQELQSTFNCTLLHISQHKDNELIMIVEVFEERYKTYEWWEPGFIEIRKKELESVSSFVCYYHEEEMSYFSSHQMLLLREWLPLGYPFGYYTLLFFGIFIVSSILYLLFMLFFEDNIINHLYIKKQKEFVREQEQQFETRRQRQEEERRQRKERRQRERQERENQSVEARMVELVREGTIPSFMLPNNPLAEYDFQLHEEPDTSNTNTPAIHIESQPEESTNINIEDDSPPPYSQVQPSYPQISPLNDK